MSTKLFLRNTSTHGISGTGDGILYDMLTTAGSSSDTTVTNTTASGTEIQATKTAGGSTVAWISGRAPIGGFTLTAADISLWQIESNMNANIGGRFRIFKRTAAGVITELGGGPFDDGAEMQTSNTEDIWTANPTDTAFAEDDRILIRYYLTNIGTMAGSFTGTMTFNAADTTTGDSFFNIAETVTFKANRLPLTAAQGSFALSGQAASLKRAYVLSAGQGSFTLVGQSVLLSRPPAFSYYRFLTVDATQVGATDLTNFPVLVRFTDATFKSVANSGHVQNSSGFDILFFTSNDFVTQLDHEIEKYDPATGEVVMWVKLPTISHTVNTSFVIAYGSSSYTTSQEHIASVWSNSFVGVWHLKNGTTLSFVNSVTGTAGTISGPTAGTGQIDGAGTFGAASTDKITTDVTASATLRTYTIWARRTGVGGGSAGRMFNKGTTSTTEYLSYVDSTSSYDYSQFWTTGASWRAPAPTINDWHFVCVRYDSSSSSNAPLIDIDNVSQTVTPNSSPTGSKTTNSEAYVVGNRAVDNIRNWAGDLDEFRIADVIRSDGWVAAEKLNQQTGSTFLTLGSEVGSRALAAAFGSFALTGQAAQFKRGYVLAASSGSFSETGNATALKVGRRLTANNGSLALAGQTAILKYGRLVSAQAGSFPLTGNAVSLKATRILNAGQGSFTETGQAVVLRTGKTVTLSQGSFTETGNAANLLIGRKLSAAVGGFTETGSNASLLFNRRAPALFGSFALSGTAASLLNNRKLVSGTGTFVETGVAVGLVYQPAGHFVLSAQNGSLALTGNAANLLRSRVAGLSVGTFSEAGQSSAFLWNRKLAATAGNFFESGFPIALLRGLTFGVSPGLFSSAGQPVTLLQNRVLSPSAGNFVEFGQNVGLATGRTIQLSAGSFLLEGSEVQPLAGRFLSVSNGVFALTGSATLLRAERILRANGGLFTVSGANVTLSFSGIDLGIVPTAILTVIAKPIATLFVQSQGSATLSIEDKPTATVTKW